MSPLLISIAAAVALYCVAVIGKKGYGPGEQDWGFVDVRTGAHMFYWLYYTTATANYIERPLAIWLQGGPGSGSTHTGNFKELGPIDENGNPRNHTWVKDMNVLFIDNPVGTGFSYVDDDRYLTTNNNQIAKDLVSFMKGFYKKHLEFEEVPLHIFSQSYGGKMAPEFALELWYAIQSGELKSNLKSVALGSPWASPIDSVLSWAPLLLNMGVVDQDGYEKIMISANKTAEFVEAEQWFQATSQQRSTQEISFRESNGVDFYNILKPVSQESFLKRQEKYLMKHVAEALNLPANITYDSLNVRSRLNGDFMKPVINIVAELLDKTHVKVSVISGQLDIICSTPGNVNWINKMQWSYKSEYLNADREGIYVDHVLEGYEKNARNFSMFWVNRAGHNIPADNPAAMSYILRKITNFG